MLNILSLFQLGSHIIPVCMNASAYDLLSRYLWRKTSRSTCWAFRTLPCVVTMFPAVEKSVQTLVGGMHRKHFAILSSWRHWSLCSSHQLRGFSRGGKGFSSLNLLVSAAAASCADFGAALTLAEANVASSQCTGAPLSLHGWRW